jgi:outer membrane protein assembly factor BamA
MRRFQSVVCACLAAAAMVALGSDAVAQDRPEPESSAPPAYSGTAMDVGDLWHKVRGQEFAGADTVAPNRRYLVFAPSIGSKPSTGLNGGFSWNTAFFSGDPSSTHISSLNGGLKFSQKKQTMLGVRLNVFTGEDRWFIQGDNRMSWTSQNTYALGGRALATSAENLKFDFFRLYETAYRNVRPGLFVGAGVNFNTHSHVQPNGGSNLEAFDQSAYVSYSARHGLPESRQTSAGTSVSLRYDTRDNGINAQRGVLASATVRTFVGGVLGGDSTWQLVNLDVRTYRSLTKDARQKIAFWFVGDLVAGGVAPYFDLPTTGGSDGRTARGYAEGRYRGEHLLYWETEYRGTITPNGLLGVVAFANVTTVGSEESGDRLFGAYAPAAGAGLRVLLNKRSRTNLCADYGWGQAGSRGFYLAIQEAF